MKGKLYLVPTPIGNLEDITLRALRILKEVDTILAEDTRVTMKLLKHYEINTRLGSYHQHNEHKITNSLIDRLLSGETIALVTDAGTPGISDPGFLITRECVANEVEVECLPGATAFVPALVNSGLACDRFVFEGFLPHKKGRMKKLNEIKAQPYTTVLYESPFRLMKTLEQIAEVFGQNHRISISRELTKMFEENFRGTVGEALLHYEKQGVKGEIVLIIDAFDPKSQDEDMNTDD